MKIPETRKSTQYNHPLLINGKRYMLNMNPFHYAEEGVLKYWPEKVETLANELAWKEFVSGKNEPSSAEELELTAARMLIPDFLTDDNFLEYFKQDGGKMIPEITEIRIFPKATEKIEVERDVS